MDLFYNAFVTFFNILCFGYLDFQRRARNHLGFIKNILICVSKINQSIMGLERHEDK